MEVENVKKYVGKKVLIILRNNFQYTTTIPNFSGTSFSIISKFNEHIEIDCDYIAFIKGEEYE